MLNPAFLVQVGVREPKPVLGVRLWVVTVVTLGKLTSQ